jgi:hypothetical protein
MVSIAAKWLTLRGRWHYWFVVLDVPTELPGLAAVLPSRRPWACRWLGRPRYGLTHVPPVIIPDGRQADASLLPAANHGLCRLHPPQGVTPGLTQHVATDAERGARQPMMTTVVQTRDKRTVRRRRARWRARASAVGMTPWVSRVEAKWPQRICRVGRTRLPSTTNAIERFLRAFQRLYATRGGVHAVLSAQRELRLV